MATVHAVSKAPVSRNKLSKTLRSGNDKPAKACWRCGEAFPRCVVLQDCYLSFLAKRGTLLQYACLRLNRSCCINNHRAKRKEQKAYYVQMRDEDRRSDRSDYTLFAMSDSNRSTPLVVTMRANPADLEMEVDTGAALSLVSEQHTISRSAAAVISFWETAPGECLEAKGAIQVKGQYQDQEADLKLIWCL